VTGPMSAHRSEHVTQPPIVEVEKTISCTICEAVYAPSLEYTYFLNAPSMALESALMSMCHFCFRCRRPACPACWDDVHGVCGSCVQEAHLSFRTAPEPLSGLLFPPRQILPVREQEHRAPSPLTCIRPGRFQQTDTIDEISTRPTQEIPATTTGKSSAKLSREAQAARDPQQAESPSEDTDIAELETRPGRRTRIARGIERALTIALLLILLIVITLIVAASLSVRANTLIADTLHIDIRAEIAYLLRLIEQLH
jgi:hypothetical protein